MLTCAPVRAVAGLLVASLCGTAHANPAEVFGMGSRSAALAGAVSARVDDFSAAYYNPAGLALAPDGAWFGVQGATSRLHANQERLPIQEPIGIVAGITAPAPLHGPLENRVRIGIGLYMLPSTWARVLAHLPDEPFYPYYDNRTQRLVVLPMVAARITDSVAVGIGFNALAGLAGQVVVRDGPTRSLAPRLDEAIPPVLSFNVGGRLTVDPHHSFAIVFRQTFSIPFTTVADTTVAGSPIKIDLAAEGLYSPDELVFGYAYREEGLTFSADVTGSRWTGYPGPYVKVTSELPFVGALASHPPDVPWRNTIGLRLGLENDFGGTILRGGYGYETSPVPPDQAGVTNLLDGPKHLFALGFGFVVDKVKIDAHVQVQLVGSRTLRKTISSSVDTPTFDALHDEDPKTPGVQISNPGYPTMDSGGQVFSGGLTVEFPL